MGKASALTCHTKMRQGKPQSCTTSRCLDRLQDRLEGTHTRDYYHRLFSPPCHAAVA